MRGTGPIPLGLLAAALLVPGPAVLGAQSTQSRWRSEDRVVIGDYSRISSVAVGQTEVYLSTPESVALWNPGFQEWKGPYQPPTLDYLAGVFEALVDPLDNSLWMARSSGWVHFQETIQLWDRGTAPGRVQAIAFDRANPGAGLFLRTTNGWFVVGIGSGVAQPSRPPADPEFPVTPEQALRQLPTLRSNSAAILRTPGLGTARYSAAAEAFDRQGWYVGTWGAGLLYLPTGAALPERVPFGLRGNVARSLFRDPRGVWVATNQTATAPAAITLVRSDLGSFFTLTGSPAFGLRYHQSADMVGNGEDLWVATDIGAVRVPTGGGSIEVFDETRGLPDRRALSLAAYRGNVYVGSQRGMVRIDDSLHVSPVAPGFFGRAWALALSPDTVWVATNLGIRYALEDSDVLLEPGALRASPGFQVPVRDLAWKADTLVGLTRDEMLWRDPESGGWTLGPNLSGLLGRLYRMALWRDGFWVAGERGVVWAGVGGSGQALLRVGEDLPGVPFDLVVQGQYLWVGTNAGVVRWTLDAIRP